MRRPRVASLDEAYRARLTLEARRVGLELPEPRRTVSRDTDDWGRKLDLLIREQVPAASFTFGLPSQAVLGELARAGVETIVTVTDEDEARAAVEGGVDALCVQGADAGGHRGTLDPDRPPNDPRRCVVRARPPRTRSCWHSGPGPVGGTPSRCPPRSSWQRSRPA